MYSIIYTPPNGFTRILQYSEFSILQHSLRGIASNILTGIDKANIEYGFISNEKHVFCFDLSNYRNDNRIVISIIGVNEVEKIKIEKIIKFYIDGNGQNSDDELDIHIFPAFR
jgi:hypothetical protein